MLNIKKETNMRDFQHKLSFYIELAKTFPITVTKHGKAVATLVNLDTHTFKKKSTQKTEDLTKSEFVGMHKNKKGWKNKSTAKIASELRNSAWYGR